ncbi:MAG: polysaccharide deacetylase family protein [Verrucomicrobia bacterium]|nr:polysaccharide deacetylase family protein [Verrucomicrobiota bacterium]
MLIRSFLALSLLLPWVGSAQETPAAHPATKPATYSSCHVDGQYIAMTFDDGPSAENTPRLLDLLKQRGIKATFFLIGQNAAEHPEIVKRILEEGHEIGNHSWTHPQLSKLSDERVTDEIVKTQNAIHEASGYTPTLLRPPYGAITQRQREWIESRFGLSVILWSVDPFDWKRPGVSVIEQRILSGAEPGAIVLSHDIHKQTVDAMPATLDALIKKGYKFVTVSQLIAMNHPKPAASAAKVTVMATASAAITPPAAGNPDPAAAKSPSAQTPSSASPSPSGPGQVLNTSN